MHWLLVLIVLLSLGGIILLSGKSPFEKKTRELFLQELAKLLNGTLELIEGEDDESSFRILFRFEGEDFVYEDLEKKGFKSKVYKAYLKVKTPSKLTVRFTERKHSTKIKTDIFIASEVSTNYVDEHVGLEVPKHLKDLNVTTNDTIEANRLFDDRKISSILKRYKNVDSRGYPFLSLGLVDGTVTLEFHAATTFQPNLSALQGDIASIEDHLEKIMVIVRKLKENSQS